MGLLGRGRCRGPGWAARRWPLLRGRLPPRQCAHACAARKGCTAFDLSEPREVTYCNNFSSKLSINRVQQDGSVECALYGHKKVSPASGVPGNCYVLTEVEGVVPGGLNTQLNQQEEEEEEEVEVTGEVEYHQVNIRVSSNPCLSPTQSDCVASILCPNEFQWLGWAWPLPRPGLDIQAVARHSARPGRPGLRPRLRRPQPLHSLRPGGHRVRAVRPQAGQHDGDT